MVPIIKDDVVIGGLSILTEMKDLYNLFEKLKKSQSIIKKLEKHMHIINRTKYSFEDIISVDYKSIEVKNMAKKAASTDSNVLITGETGTGKELYAHSIHQNSKRRDFGFVAINSASFDPNLLEAELFGYEEDAFTGAKKDGKLGLFEVANGGTIFLDEIGEMDINIQARLLRVLQEGKIRRVGGIEEIDVDVRIIGATNRDLESMANENKFRRDLFYRLSVFPIMIPPLRERPYDIEPLITHFLKFYSDKMKRSVKISDNAMALLINYSWPGNVRELRNALEFSMNMSDDFLIRERHLPEIIRTQGIKSNLVKLKTMDEVVRQAEKDAIDKAILIYGDTVTGKKEAAKALNISLATLYNKLKE